MNRIGEGSTFQGRDVPCRGKCGATVSISGFVVGLVVEASNFCRLKSWEPIKTNEVAFCEACGADWQRQQEEKSEAAFLILRALEKALRSGGNTGAILMASPPWFRQENEREIAAILASAGKLSTRKPERGLR